MNLEGKFSFKKQNQNPPHGAQFQINWRRLTGGMLDAGKRGNLPMLGHAI